MLTAVARHDPLLLRDAVVDALDVHADCDLDALGRALARFMARNLEGGRPTSDMFTHLLRLLVDFELPLPSGLAAVFRTLATLESTLVVLAPDFRISDEAADLAARWAADELRSKSPARTVADELTALLPVLQRLPHRLDRLASMLEGGRLSVSVRVFADEPSGRAIGRLVDRAILAFLGAMLGITSVMLLGMRGGPELTPSVTAFEALGYAGMFASTALVLRVIVGIAQDRTL
jgi:ubiquinone biosynthesis protein